MTTEIDLLPLPEKKRLEVRYECSFGSVTAYGHSDDALRDYARANVARNTALLRAEIKALREGEEEWRRRAAAQAELHFEAEVRERELAKALAELITWIPSADTYRRLGFDPAAPMRALERARAALSKENSND